MLKHLWRFLITTCLIGACTRSHPTPTPLSSGTDQSAQPVIQPQNPPTPPSSLQSKDTNQIRGNVFIKEANLLIRESYPPQIVLALSGDLPTPCHQLIVESQPPDAEGLIAIVVYSTVKADMMCIQVTKPFEKNVELGSFPSGHYQVVVNGKKIGEFDS